MIPSHRLITDLQTLANGQFSAETHARAKRRLAGEEALISLLGVALARASELKMTLMKLQTVVDGSDPLAALLNAILAALD